MHVEDAAEVLPDPGRQRKDESDRRDPVTDDRAWAESADLIAPAHRGLPPAGAEETHDETEPQRERQHAHEDEVVRELGIPGLGTRARLREAHVRAGRRDREAREHEQPAHGHPQPARPFPWLDCRRTPGTRGGTPPWGTGDMAPGGTGRGPGRPP